MNYKIKRNFAGLGKYFVSRELGLPFKIYTEVEKGLRTLNNEQLEKFTNIVGVGKKEHKLKFDIDTGNAVKWLKSVNFTDACKELNVSLDVVAKDLLTSKGTMYDLKSGRNNNRDKILMLHDYFHDKNNIRIKKERKQETTPRENLKGKNQKGDYDYEKIVKALGFKSQIQLESMLGLAQGNITWWKKGRLVKQKYLDAIDKALQEKGYSLVQFKLVTYDQIKNVFDKTEERINVQEDKISPETQIEPTEVLNEEIEGNTEEVKDTQEEVKDTKRDEIEQVVEEAIELLNEMTIRVRKLHSENDDLKDEVSFLRDTINTINKLAREDK